MKIFRKKSNSAILVSLLSCLFLVACNGEPESSSKKKRGGSASLVEVIEVTSAPIVTTRTNVGTIEARQIVRIHNQENGKITQLDVYPGDKVTQGQLLIQLDAQIISAELRQAKARDKKAQIDLKRIQKLIPRKLASEEELGHAKTNLEETQAQVQLLTTRLTNTKITAPFDGIVTERYFEPNDIVPLHQHILTIIDPNSLFIKVHATEIILSHLQINQIVTLRIDALGSQKIEGRISRIYPTIDNLTRQGTIEIEFTQQPEKALLGQLCRVSINSQTPAIISVPLNVVQYDSKGAFVFQVKNNKAHKIRVMTGIQIEQRIEIISGLNVGDLVVSKGLQRLRNGNSVTITKTGT